MLDAFGSIEKIITASKEKLQSVDGIGKNTAEKIRWIVSEKIARYGSLEEFFI